ncbi:surface-adhesin E family protein [Neisseria sp. CCUG12390]|uniref:surface-adhesin E family protein n=1 Tax=Neisseria sp. CCUG12390 TaxID=3392035 RepID=UPI003A102AC9
MNIQWYRFGMAASLALFLAACASSGSSGSGNWQSIGTTSNGNIKVSVDKSSIKKNGQLVTFRDRKVISKLSEEQFANTPAYKTALADWEIHCTNKTYRLTALQLLDERGQTVTNQRYTATNLRPMGVMSGSITEKQYELVCGKKL